MKQIFTSGIENYEDHREDFETCPSCDFKMDSEKWDKIAHTLILEPKFYRKGSVATISDCPECSKSSWVHQWIDSFSNYSNWPKKWQKAATKRGEKLKLQALREWAFSLCGKCKLLTGATIDYHAYRHCKNGSSGPATKECSNFKMVKVK